MDVNLTEVPGGGFDLHPDIGIEVDDDLNEEGPGTGEVRATSMPPDPIMGKYYESYPGASDTYAISGGKPLADWSGLDPKASNMKKSRNNPRLFRPLSAHHKNKAYKERIKGLETKFKEGDNLNDFRTQIQNSFVKNGLDTITYAPDLANPEVIYSVVKDSPRFVGNLQKALEEATKIQTKYDDFDRDNSEAALEFLINSLDDELARRLEIYLEPEDSFAHGWLRLMSLLVSVSSTHYENVKNKVRNCNTKDYSQENIHTMTETMHHLISELLSANQYEPGITLSMLQNISLTCSQKGLFEHYLNNKIVEVDREVSVCNYMDKIDANEHMTKKGLDPKAILSFLTLKYNQLLRDNLWTPAKNPIDSTKPPSLNVASVCLPADSSDNNMLKAFLNLLQANVNPQKAGDQKKTPKNSPCHICGKLGHWAPDCPQKKERAKQDMNKAGKGNTKVADKGSQSWRRTRPANGEAEAKMHKGKEYFWCEKCKRWTPSHGTSTHRGSKGKQDNSPSDVNLATNLPLDLSVWNLTTCAPSNHVDESFNLLQILLVLGYFAMCLYFLPTFGVSRGTCLCGLITSLFNALTSIWPWFKTFAVATGYPFLVEVGKFFFSLMSHLNNFPFGCLLAPGLWSLLFFAISYVDQYSQQPPTSKKRMRQVRQGRVKDCRVSKWYRQHKRKRLQKLSLRQRLRTKAEEDYEKLVNPFHNFEFKSTNNASRHQPKKYSTKKKYGRGQRSFDFSKSASHQPKKYRTKKKYGRGQRSHNFNSSWTDTQKGSFGAMIYDTFLSPSSNSQNVAASTKFHHGTRIKSTGAGKNMTHCDNCAKHLRHYKHDEHKPTSLPKFRSCTEKKRRHSKMPLHLHVASSFNDLNIFNNRSNKHESFPVVWDSGASVCVTNCRDDFISFTKNASIRSLGGYANGQEGNVRGEGYVIWSIEDVHGVLRTLKLKAYYLPDCRVRLMSTNTVLSSYPGETFLISDEGGRLSGVQNDPCRGAISAPKNRFSNLIVSCPSPTINIASVSSIVHENHNLSGAEKELLRWHERLGHLAFSKVQFILRSGTLATTEAARRLHRSASKCNPIKCAACLFAKQRARSAPGLTRVVNQERSGVLKKDNLLP